MNRFLKFVFLPFREKILFLKCIALLSYYRIHLETTSLQSLLTCVEKESLDALSHNTDCKITPYQLTRIIRGASCLVPFSTCLSQSITGKIIFAEYGNETQIHIGVHKDISVNFAAHAWLTMGNKILLGHLSDLHQYKEFSKTHFGRKSL